MTRVGTLGLLAGLYVSQFLGVSFFSVGLVAILREGGASLEQLAAAQTLGFLWAVKFLWAPLLDRYGSRRLGHYRGWLLVLQPALALALLALIALDPVGDFGVLLVLAGLVVLLSATQDIASDALAVRALHRDDRGLGNGLQIAGGYLGNILGGGVTLVVYGSFGWAAAIAVLAAFTLLPTWQVLRYREPARAVEPARRPSFRELVTVFRAPGVARWTFGVLPLLWCGITGASALSTPMLVDAGWSTSRIGVVTTTAAGICAIAAAAGSGLLVRRFGRRRTLLGCAAALVFAVLSLVPLAGGDRGVLLAGGAVCLLNAAYAAVATVVHTVTMDLSRPDSAGTDFTVLTSVSFGVGLVAGALALAVAGSVGYVPVVLGLAALLAVAGVVVARLFREAPEAGPADAVADAAPEKAPA